MSQEKYEKFQAGNLKDDNLLVVSEECMMVAQDKEDTDNKENCTVIFDSVHLSHTQEFRNDLMEQELKSNGGKDEDLHSKALNTVPYLPGNSEESTMMMEPSIWCENLSSPTLQEDLLSDETYQNSSNNCGIMEQKPKLVEQVRPGPMDDGLNEIIGSNQDETMRIDADMMKTPHTCATNSSFKEVYFFKFLYVRAIHIMRLYQMNLEIQNEDQNLINGY